MDVINDDFNDVRTNSLFKHAKISGLRISSCRPRRLEEYRADKNGYLVNIDDSGKDIPSFNIGPCKLQQKPREVKSARLSLSIRNLALSIRASRFKIKERAYEMPSEKAECSGRLDDGRIKVVLPDVKECSSLKDNLKDDELGHYYRKPQETYCDENKAEDKSHDEPAKSKRKKRQKTAKKIKIKRTSSVKDQKKLRLGNKKTSRNGEDQRKQKDGLSLSNRSQIQHACVKAGTQKQSKPLQNINAKAACSTTQSQNPLSNITSSNSKIPARCVRVYLSEKHSGTCMGIPAVPPGTPGLELQKEIEWIPSLSDIKSQRTITTKLSNLVAKQCKKEKKEKLEKEQKMQEDEQRKHHEMQTKMRQRQRAEIYALNTILTQVENEQYERLKKNKGMPV